MLLRVKKSNLLSAAIHARSCFSISSAQPAEEIVGDLHTQNCILGANAYLKELIQMGNIAKARRVFEEMPDRNNVTWTTMISAYTTPTTSHEALTLFSHMILISSITVDPFLLSITTKACALSANRDFGESLHGFSVKTGLVLSVFVGSSLLHFYMKTGKIGVACSLFDEMPLKNAVSWTSVVTGLVHSGLNVVALGYFFDMTVSNVEQDSFTYAIALKACAGCYYLTTAMAIHTRTMKNGFDLCSYVANMLAIVYHKCGKPKYGMRIFARMRTQDVVSWTSLITARVQAGRDVDALQAFREMRKSTIPPNEYTISAVITACVNISRFDWGQELHCHSIRTFLSESMSVANCIMSMYSKCGKLAMVSLVFDRMLNRDVVSWSTAIAACSYGGCGEEAFMLLALMRKEGSSANEFPIAAVLSVCGDMAILEQGRQLHSHVISAGLDTTPMVLSALINMYSKCGSIHEASRVFNFAERCDIVSWTAMISGYAEHGWSWEAIDVFERIRDAGLVPDEVTFIGVLCACSHAGLVDLGFQYFNSIPRYNVRISKEHYGCMIDLLCRAGRLKDAEELIMSMPYEQDDVILSTLLRACMLKGDMYRGRHIAERIIEIEPNSAGAIITLANIYSSKGKWGEAARLRKLLRTKGVVKEPGWSSIKVKNYVSSFVSGDRRHGQSEEIYELLNILYIDGRVGPKTVGEMEFTLYDFEK